jgi:DNA-binding HxlR family transcriptional regulator
VLASIWILLRKQAMKDEETSYPTCPVETTLKLIGNRWKMLI